MKPFAILTFCLFFFIENTGNSQNKKDLQDINFQVWKNFSTSFETLDFQLFSNIHSDDLIRVGGDQKSIKAKVDYIQGYKQRWEKSHKNQTISFRFLERIISKDRASERGIYKLMIQIDTETEKSYYGKFHVILKKEANIWKILVDYDSSENQSIDETSYNTAFAIDDFDRY